MCPHANDSECLGIRGLDLSKNLLPSWDVVASIVEELPVLEAIALKYGTYATVIRTY